MSVPPVGPGTVLRYDYLWSREWQEGRRQGVKDRPCVVVVANTDNRLAVVAITHSPPSASTTALKLPQRSAQLIGLDGEPSWIVIDEMNVLDRSDPGILPLSFGTCGLCPEGLLRAVRNGIATVRERERGKIRYVIRDESD